MITKNWVAPLFFTLFLLIGVGMVISALWDLYMSSRVARWPTTVGTILNAGVETHAGSEGSTYKVRVAYTYAVEGREYEGSRLAYGHGAIGGVGPVEAIVLRLQAAKNVMVRYDPAHPHESALSYGLVRAVRFKLIFGVVWLGFTLGFIALMGLDQAPDGDLLKHLILR